MKLNILVLHAMGDFSSARKTSKDHALCFQRYAPTHNYVYHDVNAPVTTAVQKIRFHAIILDTTALCIRYYRPRDLFLTEKERYRFLANADAIRVAFPQDNYTVTMAPRIAKGKVIVGVSGAEYPVRGFFSAYDANTGQLAWRFYTIPGDPSTGAAPGRRASSR